MNKAKKWLCLVCVLSLVWVNCAAALAQSGGEQITLRFSWWGGDARHKATLEAAELYMALNPNIKIDCEYGAFDGYYQKLVTQMAGSVEPDILQNDIKWLYDLTVHQDAFYDFYSQSDLMDVSIFDDSVREGCEVNGQLTAVPVANNAMLLIVNKDLREAVTLASNGVGEAWDWDSVLAAAEELKAVNSEYFLFNLPLNLITDGFMQVYLKQLTGKPMILEDFTLGFDHAAATDFFSYLLAMIDKGAIQSFEEAATFNNQAAQNPAWMEGKILATPNWCGQITSYSNNGFDLITERYPIAKNAVDNGIGVRPGSIFSVSKNSANVEEAVKFVNWMLTDEAAILALSDQRGVPASESARTILEGAGKITEVLVNGLNEAVEFAGVNDNYLCSNSELQKIFDDVVAKVGYRRLTPEQGAEEMIARLEAQLVELKAAN